MASENPQLNPQNLELNLAQIWLQLKWPPKTLTELLFLFFLHGWKKYLCVRKKTPAASYSLLHENEKNGCSHLRFHFLTPVS